MANTTVANSFLKGFSPFKSHPEEKISLSEQVSDKCRISISNINGDISVKSWKHNKIVIEAVKKGSEKSILDTKIKKTVTNDTVNIETAFTGNDAKCTVNYDILIPESAHLQSVQTREGKITITNVQNGVVAKTENGPIVLDNVTGPIKTSSNQGCITISTQSLISDNDILAITGKGTIKVSFPQDSDADVHLKTNSGSITSAHDITFEELTMKLNKKTLAEFKKVAQGTIGRKATNSGKKIASLKLHTSKGNIILAEA